MRKAVQAAARRTRIRRNSTGSSSSDASTNAGEAPPSPVTSSLSGPHSNNNGSAITVIPPAPQPSVPGTFPTVPTITTVDNVRRKATVEEAALTAKNYRLAKELVRFLPRRVVQVCVNLTLCNRSYRHGPLLTFDLLLCLTFFVCCCIFWGHCWVTVYCYRVN